MPPGLVHHSDRGVQYASGDIHGLLKANGIHISMTRSGNPWDNAKCESFMKTLKYEEVYGSEYRNLADASRAIGEFLEKFITRSDCIRRWATLPPPSSNVLCRRRTLQRRRAHEFAEAWGDLSMR